MKEKQEQAEKREQAVEDEAEYYDPIEGVKLVNGEMSAEDFRVIQTALGLTNVQMAEELEMKLRAIAYFRSGERKIQPWIKKLLRFVSEEYGYTF